MRLKAVLVGIAGMAAMAMAADARSVSRVWHVDAGDPDSTLCEESPNGRVIITTGATSGARYDDPSPAEWLSSGCAGSKPRHISHAEALRRLNEQTAEMTRPLDFSRDILPKLRALAAHNAAAQGQAEAPPQ